MATKRKKQPVEVVESKGIRIPIYHNPVGEYESYLLAYYIEGARKRERTKSLELARKTEVKQLPSVLRYLLPSR